MSGYTTIKVSTQTRDRLQKFGRMRESYDYVINLLMEKAEKQQAIENTKMYTDSIKDVIIRGIDPFIPYHYKYQGIHSENEAKEVLERDSENWAREYLTAPTDTSLDVAEEWRKRKDEQQRKREQWDEDTKMLEAAGVPTGKPKAPLPDQEKRNKEWDAYLKGKAKK